MKIAFYSILFMLMLAVPTQNAAFDLSKSNKHGGTMDGHICNKDTVVDFDMSPSSTISCNSASCTVASPEQSTVQFLDIGGSEETYTLQTASIAYTSGTSGAPFRVEEKGLIKLNLMSGSGKKLYIGIPFSDTMSSTYIQKSYELNLNNLMDTAFAEIKSTNLSTALPLSSLNYLNRMQMGHFYSIVNSASSPAETYLLAYYILSNSKIISTNVPSTTYSFPDTFTPTADTYSTTGDKLCWGSVSEGIFQTHLRESYPLWTAWLGILFYWLYYLLTEANENNCYDNRFKQNKWTSWGIYSLHYLGHQDYFTKLTRITIMLTAFSWYGCVLGILYYNVPPGKGPVMILWAAIIAVFTAMPITYVVGFVFIRKIYALTLQKYDTLKKMKGIFNKKDSTYDNLQKEVDDLEESLYGYYYWYYVLAFVFFTAFWIIAVHQMMQIHRDYYYFMFYWLASMGVAFGLENLVIDPLMTLIFGNYTFYRIRGFYYDFRLGERFKEIEE